MSTQEPEDERRPDAATPPGEPDPQSRYGGKQPDTDGTEDPTRQKGTSWLLLAVVLLVALLLIGFGVYFALQTAGTQEEQEEQIGEVTALFEQSKQRQREKLESGDAVGAGKQAEEDLASIADKMSEAKRSFTGDEAKIFDATNILIGQTQEHLAAYNKVVAELYESGLVRATTLDTLEDLQARRELVKRFREINNKFKQYQMTAPRTYRKLLEEQNVKPAVLQQAMEGFQSSYGQQKDLVMTVRESDEKFAVLLLQVLDLLEKNWDGWEFNEAEGGIIFEEESVAVDYEQALADLEQVALAQAEAQQKLLQSRQPAAPTTPTAPRTGFSPSADAPEQARP